MPLNYPRIVIAALGAVVAYFALGSLFFTRPSMRNEFLKYPAVYRTQADMKGVMPFGMLGMLLSMVALAVIYGMLYRGGSGVIEGARFGALVGLYALGSFVLHNHVNLNIGAKLTLLQAGAYFIEWTAVGVVIGLIYRAAA
jgi:hypothetical protein